MFNVRCYIMTAELPQQIVGGMTPILSKYGITEQTQQGRVMIAMGVVFREVNASIGKRIQKIDDPHFQKQFANLMLKRTMHVLKDHGLTEPIPRANCAKEIIEFVAALIGQEMKKDG